MGLTRSLEPSPETREIRGLLDALAPPPPIERLSAPPSWAMPLGAWTQSFRWKNRPETANLAASRPGGVYSATWTELAASFRWKNPRRTEELAEAAHEANSVEQLFSDFSW